MKSTTCKQREICYQASLRLLNFVITEPFDGVKKQALQIEWDSSY